METVLQAVAQVGFPIVCCVLLWKALTDEKDAHKEEMKGFTEALNNNTKAIVHLTDMLSFDTTTTKGDHEV